MPQVERQMLLLRQSKVDLKISACTYLYGPHNYNAKPFVPIGMKMLIHEKSARGRPLPNTAWNLLCWVHQWSIIDLGPMGYKNKGKKSVRYSVFQTQVHHKPVCDTIRCRHCDKRKNG